MSRILVVCTTDSMIWNFLIPHIKELEKRGHYVECACSYSDQFYTRLKSEHNIKMNIVCFNRSPFKVKNIKAYRQLVCLLKKKKFDTIFCHEPVGGAIGRLAGKKCGCRVVYMAHGFHFYKGAPKKRFIYYLVEKILSRYTDTLITINQEDYECALHKFYAKKCIKVDGVGVDTSKFVVSRTDFLRTELALKQNSLILLSVGELIKRKNHIAIIKSLSKHKDVDLIYAVAGEGKLRKWLSKMINKFGLNGRVFLLGYRSDINALCNSADVFVLPSIHEGLSVALMEAMACGLPVVASQIRGNVDLVDNDLGGFLVKTNDSEGYFNSFAKLLDADVRQRLGNYNKSKIKKFDISIIKEQISKLFDGL